MKASEHIDMVQQALDWLYRDGHIKNGAEFVAHKDLEMDLLKLK